MQRGLQRKFEQKHKREIRELKNMKARENLRRSMLIYGQERMTEFLIAKG
jgi:hypothetical protein